MNLLQTWLLVATGVFLSVVLPIIRAFFPKPPVALQGKTLWEAVRPYVVVGVFSALAGLLVVAAAGDQLGTSWGEALIAGYLWDSTIQKIATGNSTPPV